MKDHPSIWRRLVWRLSALFLLSLALSVIIFLHQSWTNRTADLDASLRRAAAELGAAADLGSGREPFRIPDAAAAALAPAEITALRYAVVDRRSGAAADGSSASLLHELGPVLAASRPDGSFDFRDAAGRSDRGYIATVARRGAELRVLVSGANLTLPDIIAWMMDETLRELVPILAPLFIGTMLIAPFTVRRSLRPIDRLAAEAAAIEPSHTEVRLAEDGVPYEILPLVRTINTALGRIDEGFAQQRRFTTNAAHELRTPLAILRARIDGLEDGPTRSGLIRDLDRMARMVSQLLIAGRLETQPPVRNASVDLREVARETVERLAPLASARTHPLLLTLPPAPVIIRGDAEALGDALRNLIDNALAHSPRCAAIEVAVGRDGGIEVRDHGPGIPADDREKVFERFWRSADSRGNGAGLGLSIVRTIAHGHGGTVGIADNPGGGAVFRMEFPLAAQA
jgi:signal transduction histidine kinase